MVKKQPARAGAAAPKVDMMDKFKRTMHDGTPRLVLTKNRTLNMDGTKADSRNLLMKFAQVRKGVNIEEKTDKPKQDFNTVSVQNFRKKMMEEEMKSEGAEGGKPSQI